MKTHYVILCTTVIFSFKSVEFLSETRNLCFSNPFNVTHFDYMLTLLNVCCTLKIGYLYNTDTIRKEKERKTDRRRRKKNVVYSYIFPL